MAFHTTTLAAFLVILLQLSAVDAHEDEDLLLTPDAKQNWNNNYPIGPCRANDNLPIKKWFGRGLTEYPPPPGEFMELEAGGVFTGELACNRAWTTFRAPWNKDPMEYYACKVEGPLHTKNRFGQPPDPQYFGGTSLAIAYTSDVATLHPNDLVVISVNHTSVWTRETDYPIPCGLPPCPPGGCLCTWNWIHQAANGEGYGAEIYNNMYRCIVTGHTNDQNVLPLGGGTVPVLCETDPALCVKGPKQPMYVYQAEGNNMIPQPSIPPNYNHRYGFVDGAQLDIFNDLSKTLCPDPAKVPVAVPSAVIPVDTAEAESTGEAAPDGQAAQPGQAGHGKQAVFQAKQAGQRKDVDNDNEKEGNGGKAQAQTRPDAAESNTSEYEILFNPFRTGDQAQQAFLAVPVPSVTGASGGGAGGSGGDDAARRGF